MPDLQKRKLRLKGLSKFPKYHGEKVVERKFKSVGLQSPVLNY